MATSRVLRSPARVLILAAVAATSLSLAPVSGHAEPADRPASQPAAEPTTAADAQEQVAELNHQLEIATEQYNDARILLDEREAATALASAQLGQVQRDIDVLDADIRQIARSAYSGNQVASFTALMTSASPQEFLDRVNTLDAIAGYNKQTVQRLATAQQQAADLADRAERAQSEAAAAAADMQSRKTEIEAGLPVVEALLATLTEQERQAAAALAHGPTTAAAPDRADRASRNDTAPPAPSSPIVAPTEAAQIAVDTAYAQLGDPYVWAADGPDSFDCSGLTMYSYAAAGISLPHSSRMQSTMGVYVPRDQLQPGDLVFYYSPVSHVGIYVGNNQLIEAPNSGSVVQIRDLDAWGGYSHAQRVALP
ncbi:MAG: C40 family peptidase [Geodermatophilaceae bacterium]|nr:C40 family peptidase [Geodermatophilaceae bacterium]